MVANTNLAVNKTPQYIPVTSDNAHSPNQYQQSTQPYYEQPQASYPVAKKAFNPIPALILLTLGTLVGVSTYKTTKLNSIIENAKKEELIDEKVYLAKRKAFLQNLNPLNWFGNEKSAQKLTEAGYEDIKNSKIFVSTDDDVVILNGNAPIQKDGQVHEEARKIIKDKKVEEPKADKPDAKNPKTDEKSKELPKTDETPKTNETSKTDKKSKESKESPKTDETSVKMDKKIEKELNNLDRSKTSSGTSNSSAPKSKSEAPKTKAQESIRDYISQIIFDGGEIKAKSMPNLNEHLEKTEGTLCILNGSFSKINQEDIEKVKAHAKHLEGKTGEPVGFVDAIAILPKAKIATMLDLTHDISMDIHKINRKRLNKLNRLLEKTEKTLKKADESQQKTLKEEIEEIKSIIDMLKERTFQK